MGKLDGRVAVITGAARGQGRAHALRLAEEGADVIAIDICDQIPSVAYPMATPADLAQTVKEVEALGRRIHAVQADVRDFAALKAGVDAGTAALGAATIVVANAGVSAFGLENPDLLRDFRDVLEVNLFGVYNTVQITAPAMIDLGQGGSIVLTSSTQGLTGRGGDGSAAHSGYCASKHGVVGLMRTFAYWLAPHSIRVNTVHPTGVSTPMLINDVTTHWGEDNAQLEAMSTNLLPVDLMDARDVANAVAWLVSDDARYITGVTLPVDAGFVVK
jgi:SDR family mycofactocin-dependent oxidoreductase